VILDLGLPQRSGMEVLGNWRTRGNTVPVRILTTRDAWHEKVEVLNADAVDYVAKPFRVEELCARLDTPIRRALHARILSGMEG
jgi:DNA-binding response OmpR family regulator